MGNEFGYLGKDLWDLARKLSINDERERERESERELLFSGDCKTVDYPPKAEV